MILSGNGIDHALLTFGAYVAGVPVAPVSVAYSLMSRDHDRLMVGTVRAKDAPEALLRVLALKPSQADFARFDRALPGDEKALLASIPRRQRAEIRRALGFGLQVEEGRGEAHRAAHHRVYAESVRNLGTPVFPRALFDAALDAFGESGWIVLVSKEGRPLAAMLGIDFKGVAHPYWGGGTAEAKRWRANDLIYFEVMRRAIARGCARADFGRSRVGGGPWQRKRIWDFQETPLVYGIRAADGAGARAVDPDSPRYRLQVAAWRRLPLWLANRLGPAIARGLG